MELFKLLGTIAIDNSQADEAIDETTKKAKDSEGQQSSAFKKIGGAAIAGAKVVAGAATAVGGAWVAAIEGTREYRVSMGKLETAFITSGHSAKTAHTTYSTLNSVLGDSDVTVEAANHLAKLVDNEKDMNTKTGTLLGGGEAGKEAILPIDILQAYINESVNSRNKDLIESLEMQISRLISFLQAYFPVNYQIMLDTGILAGQLAPEMNNRLADIYKNNLRGNTR